MKKAPPTVVTIILAVLAFPLAVIALFVSPVRAQIDGPVRVEENDAASSFGADVREIRFQLRAKSDKTEDPIRSVTLLYNVDDSAVQNTAVPAFRPGPSVTATYIWRVTNVLVPGTEIKYQWQVETAGGRKVTTQPKSITYNDTRFAWRESQGEHLTVFWHGSDSETSAVLLDEAKKTLALMRSQFGLSPDKPLRVYAYTRQQDYVSALATGSRQLEAAMTFGTDRIFVLAQGGSGMNTSLQGLRAEVANAIYRQKTSNPYAEPPRWLGEGLALMVSGRELSAQDYKTLGQLVEADRMLALTSLNGAFPTAERDRSLAYAQSLSLVRYMYDSFGAAKMKTLFAAIKEGATVDDALKKSLNISLGQLENRWKNALRSGAAARAAANGAAMRADRAAQGLGADDPIIDDSVDGVLADVAIAQPTRFWSGMFGKNTQWVVLGTNVFIGLALVTVIGGTIFSSVRRLRADD